MMFAAIEMKGVTKRFKDKSVLADLGEQRRVEAFTVLAEKLVEQHLPD